MGAVYYRRAYTTSMDNASFTFPPPSRLTGPMTLLMPDTVSLERADGSRLPVPQPITFNGMTAVVTIPEPGLSRLILSHQGNDLAYVALPQGLMAGDTFPFQISFS